MDSFDCVRPPTMRGGKVRLRRIAFDVWLTSGVSLH
jgi:hypothetical protein